MPAYGVSRGNPYQSFRREYNPLRGNNTLNDNNYSSLHYQSTRNYRHAPQATPLSTANPHSLSSSSLHPASNLDDHNPYLSLLKTRANHANSSNSNRNNKSNLPDLSQPRLPPQPVATPPRDNIRSRLKVAQTQHTKANGTNDTNDGWNFTAFSFIQKVWSKIAGTPSKKAVASQRSSMSQPPLSPSQQAQNPYAMNHNNSIPEDRPLTAPSPRPINDTNATNETIPITPPQQTRPNFSELLSQASTATVAVAALADNNDDAKSANTKNEGGSAVITIHNLLRQTKLSPDDAAWLHSKIDQVTHDRYDGSLSYIGPTIRASSQGLIEHLSFDDSATEHSYKTHSICSPLRQNRTNPIPLTTKSSNRYQPHPDNNSYHKRNHSYNKKMGIAARKRGRKEVFDEDEEELMMESRQQRKKMKMIGSKSTTFVRRKAFRDNFLRPIGQTSLYPFHKIVPKYNEIDGNRSPKTCTKEDEPQKVANKAINEEKNGKINDSNGFYFDQSANNKQVKMDTDSDVKRMLDSSKKVNDFGGLKHIKHISEDVSSENMEVDIKENKPLKKRRHKVRSPLKDKKPDNTLNKIQKQEADKDINDDDDDLLCKKKINDDDDDVLKKKSTPQKQILTKDGTNFVPPSTPISNAFKSADAIITETGNPNDETTNNKSNDTDELKTNSEDAAAASDVEINDASDTNDTKPNEPETNEEIETKETDNNNNNTDTSKVGENKAKEPLKRAETYLVKLMRERKERYIEIYRKRLTRIYKAYQPLKLDKIDGFIRKYGADVDDIHELYNKICIKYELSPCVKYDGSEHEPKPDKDEKEKPSKKTPEQNLSQTLTQHKKNNEPAKDDTKSTKDDSGFTFVQPGFKFSQNSDSTQTVSNNKPFSFASKSDDAPTIAADKEKNTEQKENATSKEPSAWFSMPQKPAETKDTQATNVSFENAPNPFASAQKKTQSPQKSANKTNNEWNFSVTNNTESNKKDTWSDKNQVNLFSIPSNISFSSAPDTKKENNEKKSNNQPLFNKNFKFSDAASKPSFPVSKTEVIQTVDNNESNSKKRRWSLDNNSATQNPSGFAWPSSNNDTAKSKTENKAPFSWDKTNDNNSNKDAKPQNNTFQWNKDTNNENKKNAFEWKGNNKTNENKSAFPVNDGNNNNPAAFSTNNNPSNNMFGWKSNNNNNNNNASSVFTSSNNTTNKNTFNPPFSANNNNNNKPPSNNNGWPSSNNGTNNNNNGTNNADSGWSFGGNNNNMNNMNNNKIQNNNNNNNDNGSFNYNSRAPNANNAASNSGGNSFFTTNTNKAAGGNKRKVYRARRTRKK